MAAGQRELSHIWCDTDMARGEAPFSSKSVDEWVERGQRELRTGTAIVPVGDFALQLRHGEHDRHILAHVHRIGPQAFLLLVAKLTAVTEGAPWEPVTRARLRDDGQPRVQLDVGAPPDGAHPLSSDPEGVCLRTAIRGLYALLGLYTGKPRAVNRTADDVPVLDANRLTVMLAPQTSREAIVAPLWAQGEIPLVPTRADSSGARDILRREHNFRGYDGTPAPRASCVVRRGGSGTTRTGARVAPRCLVLG